MSAWQPIETAPRAALDGMSGEGPTILLLGGFTSHGRPAVRTGHWKGIRTNAWVDTALGRCPLQPTHWMPLPSASGEVAPVLYTAAQVDERVREAVKAEREASANLLDCAADGMEAADKTILSVQGKATLKAGINIARNLARDVRARGDTARP